MKQTIFYSWQSDSPNATNRNFIQRCLENAIKTLVSEIGVESASRDNNLNLELDKDTQGLPGSPSIVESIFEKISECSAIVADLTYVATTGNGRNVPNPNVLIEYGWALSKLTRARLIPVMNSAYGPDDPESLPFDMRHLRKPICYRLETNATAAHKTKVENELTDALVHAIKLMINKRLFGTNQVFAGTSPTTNPGTFLQPGEKFVIVDNWNGSEERLDVPNNHLAFLRLIPSIPLHLSSKQALEIASSLRPMAQTLTGSSQDRNKHGAYTYSKGQNSQILFLTQLFLSGELWGIDAYLINKKRCMNRDVEFGFIASVAVEKTFANTLRNYMNIAKDHLHVRAPLRFIAGLTGVFEYRMAVPSSMQSFSHFDGLVHTDHIVYEGMIPDWNAEPALLLRPFFEQIFDECGLTRPNVDILNS